MNEYGSRFFRLQKTEKATVSLRYGVETYSPVSTRTCRLPASPTRTDVVTWKHGDPGEVAVAIVARLGADRERVSGVRRQAADLGRRVRSRQLDALPVADVGRRRRVVVDSVADDVLPVRRRVPRHLDRRRRDSTKLNVLRRRQNVCE